MDATYPRHGTVSKCILSRRVGVVHRATRPRTRPSLQVHGFRLDWQPPRLATRSWPGHVKPLYRSCNARVPQPHSQTQCPASRPAWPLGIRPCTCTVRDSTGRVRCPSCSARSTQHRAHQHTDNSKASQVVPSRLAFYLSLSLAPSRSLLCLRLPDLSLTCYL